MANHARNSTSCPLIGKNATPASIFESSLYSIK